MLCVRDGLGRRLGTSPCTVVVIHPVDVVVILAFPDVRYARPYPADKENAYEHHAPHGADYLNAERKEKKVQY